MARTANADRDSLRAGKIQASVTPAVFSGFATLAQIRGTSISKLLGALVEQAVADNADAIKNFQAKYQDARAETLPLLKLRVPESDSSDKE